MIAMNRYEENIKKLSHGDTEFEKGLIRLYIENIEELTLLLPKAIQNNDQEAIRKVSHKAKTTLTTLKADEISQLLEKGKRITSEKETSAFNCTFKNACDNLISDLKKLLG